MTSHSQDRSSYWNSYYQTARPSGANPSQFAVFVMGELPAPTCIFDIGCGSGRDSFYFASNGHHVVGIDASSSAVEMCSGLAKQTRDSISFQVGNVQDSSIVDIAKKAMQADGVPKRVLVYARFFIHAINDEEEASFLRSVAAICAGGGQFAVEFRTERDAHQAKVTPTHYRRFVNPLDFIARASALGFKVDYFVEGYGYAKYKLDDAYVARLTMTHQGA